MDIHVCKQCGSRFVYCRKCVFKPVRYKDAGFCSKECYEASKIKVEPVVEAEQIVDNIIIENVQVVDDSSMVDIDVVLQDPIMEDIAVVKPIIKNETNTYKKKKNKYKVHE